MQTQISHLQSILGAELAQKCANKYNAEVQILVGDDDSAIVKKVQESVTRNVEKWSDINHAKKSFTSHLYTLQSEFKGQLSTKVVEYFAKCFGYALAQNRNDPEGLKQSLRAIVPHAFGKHEYCSVTWCGFLKDPSSYSHASLPHGNNLKGDKMEEELTKVIDMFIQSAEKLAPLGSSQANKAVNNTIGSKAPKIRHYGASESNDFRVACAVSQKNLGHNYVSEVSTACSFNHVLKFFVTGNYTHVLKEFFQGQVESSQLLFKLTQKLYINTN